MKNKSNYKINEEHKKRLIKKECKNLKRLLQKRELLYFKLDVIYNILGKKIIIHNRTTLNLEKEIQTINNNIRITKKHIKNLNNNNYSLVNGIAYYL